MKRTIGVVIAVDRADKTLAALEGLAQLPPSERPREVLLSVGRNPSLQRNLGVKACRSDLVQFLDDDSKVNRGTFRALAAHFEDPRTAVAGGPNLVPPDAIPFERTVNAVLASWMGSFKVRSRYAAIGSVREATEKELILCNMMVRRSAFLKEGGFRVDLYPNEENEFLNRLLHKGYRMVYDPGAAVFRSRRKSLGAFCWQAFRYGRGRARQMKVYPCLSDLIHLAPAFFLVYLLTLVDAFLPATAGTLWGSLVRSPYWWAPFVLFALGAVGTGVSAASWNRRFTDALKVPVLIFLRHTFYGAGLFAGGITSIPKPPMEVALYQAAWKGKGFQVRPYRAKGRP